MFQIKLKKKWRQKQLSRNEVKYKLYEIYMCMNTDIYIDIYTH